MTSLSKITINRIIESMNNHVAMIIEKRGQRTAIKILNVLSVQYYNVFAYLYSLNWPYLLASITVLGA